MTRATSICFESKTKSLRVNHQFTREKPETTTLPTKRGNINRITTSKPGTSPRSRISDHLKVCNSSYTFLNVQASITHNPITLNQPKRQRRSKIPNPTELGLLPASINHLHHVDLLHYQTFFLYSPITPPPLGRDPTSTSK